MAVKDWSTTAADNQNADSAINWLEGQAAATVNNSARAMMAEIAKLFKDSNGTLTTGGTSSAYTVTTNNAYSAYFDGLPLIVSPNADNAAGGVTINVDALGAKSIKLLDGNDPHAGALQSGGQSFLLYDGTNFILLNPHPATVAIGWLNGIYDGGCRCNFGTTVVNLSTSYQYGPLVMYAAAATAGAVSAGEITFSNVTTVGSTSRSLFLNGVTLTGSAKVAVKTFIVSDDAKQYINQATYMSLVVFHDVGSSKDYTITINKANAQDDFSAVTQIAQSSAQSVSTGTATYIGLAVSDMGDCSNGIEIIVECDSGAVTTKGFRFADFQLELGTARSTFERRPKSADQAIVARFYRRSYDDDDSNGATTTEGARVGTPVAASTFATWLNVAGWPTPMFKTPTVTWYSPATGTADRVRNASGTPADFTVSSTQTNGRGAAGYPVLSTSVGISAGDIFQGHYVADARISL